MMYRCALRFYQCEYLISFLIRTSSRLPDIPKDRVSQKEMQEWHVMIYHTRRRLSKSQDDFKGFAGEKSDKNVRTTE